MEKSKGFVKSMFFSCFILIIVNGSYGQKALPIYEGINYSVSTLVYDNTNWWCLDATPVNDVAVTLGSLTYPGLLESTANKLNISGDGDDFVIWFGDQPSNTKIYYSFIFQVTDMTGISANTPADIAGFTNSPDLFGAFGCSIIIQKDASDPTKFNIGQGIRTILHVWHTIDGTPAGTKVKYSFNTPILVVAAYDITGTYVPGSPDDKSSLWINPSSVTFENTLPPTPLITGDLTGSGINDINPVNRFYIKQDAPSNTPTLNIDEVRIGLTWASVTPKSISTGTQEIFSEKTRPTIYPNPVKDMMRVDIKSSDINVIEIYNLTGNRIISKKINPGITNVDVSNLSQGVYLVSLKGSGVIYNKKFIKK
jgi:hypothetical protein